MALSVLEVGTCFVYTRNAFRERNRDVSWALRVHDAAVGVLIGLNILSRAWNEPRCRWHYGTAVGIVGLSQL